MGIGSGILICILAVLPAGYMYHKWWVLPQFIFAIATTVGITMINANGGIDSSSQVVEIGKHIFVVGLIGVFSSFIGSAALDLFVTRDNY